ncbi:MAG: hypothetical protein DI538_04090 [Azospira oryzae]|nr:MAG: hypothetical protein DI538_04090 [Azospira oryzae]
MSKRIAILQSNYIPWKGYFDIIGSVDEFIFYDEVQYTKNDWRNRNKIKTLAGLQWITIPVYHNLNQKLSQTIPSDSKWSHKHWNTLKTNYSKAPNFKRYSPFFEEFYQSHSGASLSEINQLLIRSICGFLNITTRITNSSDYELKGDPTEKLINLCKQTGATHYLSGPAAKTYLRESLFMAEQITIEWMNYDGYPEYPQLYPPFEHGVSIVDLLFNVGPDSRCFMKS